MSRTKEKQITVDEWLVALGIPSNIKGYTYMRWFIQNCGEDVIGKSKMKLYEIIAEANNTTISRTERAIRHAVEISCSRINSKLQKRLFGNSVENGERPTTSQFLCSAFLGYKNYCDKSISELYEW